MKAKPGILIIGAGIGGLSAAIALRREGYHVEVFERARELKEVGAGIGLSANAMRVLKHLGLMQQTVDCGTVIEAAVGYTSGGGTLSRMAMNLADVPTVCLHRADLQQALLSALPADCIHLGEQFVALQETGDGVTARFASGRTAVGAALIGADGLRSKVRAQLLGDGEAVYRGYQCWRGVCHHPVNAVLTETFGLGLRVGLVPLGRRGTAWWCTANEAENATDPGDGAKSRLLRWFGNWHSPIPEVFTATDPAAIIKTPICDRRPVRTWSRGRCTLIGDAAHPTTPNMGQGGCMAMEDAIVLARCLANEPNPSVAFRHYQRLRYARTARVINLSRFYGVIGQWESPAAAWLRNKLFRLTSGAGATKAYIHFTSYDPTRVPMHRS